MPENQNKDNKVLMVHLLITRASVGDDGIMRWQGVMSDTNADRLEERTSLQLYDDWISHIQRGVAAAPWLPEPQAPFLGIAHYPRLNGYGEAGETERVRRDGSVFKAGGIFYDTDVGVALYKSISEELALVERGVQVEQPIRISSAWWDTCHSHGDYVFTRKSINDECPLCIAGVKDKVYLGGQLDHFAATRSPINPRTNLGLEEKAMAKVTKKSDASSVIGDELAEQLDKKHQATMVGKSEGADEQMPGLVIKSDDDETEAEDTTEEVADTAKSEAEEVAETEGDGTQVEEAELEVKAETEETEETEEMEEEDEEEEEEEEEQEMEEKSLYADHPAAKPEVDDLAGVTDFKQAEKIIEQKETLSFLAQQIDLWNRVVGSIMQSPYEVISDKCIAVEDATTDMLKNLREHRGIRAGRMTARAAHDLDEFEQDDLLESEIEIDEGGITTMSEQEKQAVEIKSAADLGEAMQMVLQSDAAREDKYLGAQQAIESYALAIKSEIDDGTDATEVTEIAEAIDSAIGETKSEIAQVAQSLATVVDQIGLLTAKFETMNAAPVQKSEDGAAAEEQVQVPVQRSVAAVPPLNVNVPAPNQPNAAQIQRSAAQQPLTLRQIARRSVGLQ